MQATSDSHDQQSKCTSPVARAILRGSQLLKLTKFVDEAGSPETTVCGARARVGTARGWASSRIEEGSPSQLHEFVEAEPLDTNKKPPLVRRGLLARLVTDRTSNRDVVKFGTPPGCTVAKYRVPPVSSQSPRLCLQVLWSVRMLALTVACPLWVLAVSQPAFRHRFSSAVATLLIILSALLLISLFFKLPRPEETKLWMGTWLVTGVVAFLLGTYVTGQGRSATRRTAQAAVWTANGVFGWCGLCFTVFGNHIIMERRFSDATETVRQPLRVLNHELSMLMEHARGWVHNGENARMAATLENFQIHAKGALDSLAEQLGTDHPAELTAGLTDYEGFFSCPKCLPPAHSFKFVIRAGDNAQKTTCLKCHYEFRIDRSGAWESSAEPLRRPQRSNIVGAQPDDRGRLFPFLQCSNGHDVPAKIQTRYELAAVCSDCKEIPIVTVHQFAAWQRKHGRESA